MSQGYCVAESHAAIDNFDCVKSLELALMERLATHIGANGKISDDLTNIFVESWIRRCNTVISDYLSLYGESGSSAETLAEILISIYERWQQRSAALHQRDIQKSACTDYYNSQSMIGASCYIDLFAGNIAGLQSKISYLRALGINYLYLLPPFKAPDGENDGGFSVSDYQQIRPELGSMADLQDFVEACHQHGINVVLDFVLNHTSDEHDWAVKAQKGIKEYEEYYIFFDDEQEVKEILKNVEATFPDKGENIVFNPKVNKWVWTTFNLNQWDLNYKNPNVLGGMLDNALFLANVGIDVLRLDAISLVWKEKGTSCKSHPKIRTLIRLFKQLATLAAPALEFKSEAIVKPHEIYEYVGEDAAALAYRPLMSSTLWHALATSNAELLALGLKRWSHLPEGCAWISYLRSHDDVPWVFSDIDIHSLGADAQSTRIFLDRFYSGCLDEGFACGLPFQRDKVTQLSRISGTTASLAGLEKAINANNHAAISIAIQRILLLHSVLLSAGGLPLLYLGDEIAALNDYSFVNNASKSGDSRWVNRPAKDWARDDAELADKSSAAAQVFAGMTRMISARRNESSFHGSEIVVLPTVEKSLLVYRRGYGLESVTVLANFSRFGIEVSASQLCQFGLCGLQCDLIDDVEVEISKGIELAPYASMWLKQTQGAR